MKAEQRLLNSAGIRHEAFTYMPNLLVVYTSCQHKDITFVIQKQAQVSFYIWTRKKATGLMTGGFCRSVRMGLFAQQFSFDDFAGFRSLLVHLFLLVFLLQ